MIANHVDRSMSQTLTTLAVRSIRILDSRLGMRPCGKRDRYSNNRLTQNAPMRDNSIRHTSLARREVAA